MELYTDAEWKMIEARIIEPCLEILESIARKKNSKRDYAEYLLQERRELVQKIKDKGEVVIPEIVVVLSTKCTLKCKNCSNLMQYYKKPSDLEIRTILEELEQFFSLADRCVYINVIGGEPLIYPDLDCVLDYLIKNEKVRKIEITTNGTVVPNEELLERMKNEKVEVKISDYGRVDTVSKLIMALDKYGIESECCTNEKWVDIGGVEARNRTEADLRKLYMACKSGKMCKTLFNGKLFDCPRAAHLMDLGYAKNIDYLDIFNCSKQELLTFFTKDVAYACDYCDFMVEEKKYIEPAVQMNGSHFERSSHTLISRKIYGDIVDAKQYWEQQFYKSEQVVKELKKWTGELESAKEYFLKRIEKLEEENEQLKKNANQVTYLK